MSIDSQELSSPPRRLPRAGHMTNVDQAVLERGRVATAQAPLPAEHGPRLRQKRVRPANWVLNATAAVTGTLLALFVTIHMVGNLKVFAGADAFNSYAHWLRVVGYPLLPEMSLLWIVRFVMAGAIILHIWATLLIRYRGAKQRGARRSPMMRAGSIISRLMLTTGLVLLVFIIIHILDLTTGHINGSFLSPTATESFAYENLIASFQRPLFAGVYVFSMLALAAHLIHGLWLIATDLGITGGRIRPIWKAVGYSLGVVVAAVNLSIPVAVQLGVLA
ncbi:succinate dehydrogenase cytochrome b subunit [Flaviflexus salsibiostraticola]|nr:succinate dehydrogenase cytochrome b subunit [Flaviflexus salsibiostraticola]